MIKKIITRSAMTGNSKNENNKNGKAANQDNEDPFATIDEENPTIKDLYKLTKDMFSSLNFLANGYDEFNNKIAKLEKENEVLKAESRNFQRRLQYIETDYYYQQQLQLQNYITIHGIPRQHSEELIKTVIQTAGTLDVNITPNNIKSCRAIHNKNKSNASPIIIVEFDDENIKNKIKTNYKNNGPIIAAQIIKNTKGTSDEHRKIYVNDYLCSYYKELFENTKKIKTTHNVKFVWTKNGKIFVRQKENSPIYKVKNYNDLSELQETLQN